MDNERDKEIDKNKLFHLNSIIQYSFYFTSYILLWPFSQNTGGEIAR